MIGNKSKFMNKIEEVVDNLNTRLWGMNGDENTDHVFIYTKAGYIESISLNLNFDYYSIKIDLWNDDNDDREFNEKPQQYEDLEEFIVKKYKNITKEMKKLNKSLKNECKSNTIQKKIDTLNALDIKL